MFAGATQHGRAVRGPALHPPRADRAGARGGRRTLASPAALSIPAARFTTLVERTPDQEIWLMSWLRGQGTDLHNHGGATGAFTVVAGTSPNGWPAPGHRAPDRDGARVRAGRSRVFGPGYVHRVTNAGAEPAVSIHVYRPARLPMINYRFGPGAELSREI
jgi:quercetin dioxygenase-like cupin family protein